MAQVFLLFEVIDVKPLVVMQLLLKALEFMIAEISGICLEFLNASNGLPLFGKLNARFEIACSLDPSLDTLTDVFAWFYTSRLNIWKLAYAVYQHRSYRHRHLHRHRHYFENKDY